MEFEKDIDVNQRNALKRFISGTNFLRVNTINQLFFHNHKNIQNHT